MTNPPKTIYRRHPEHAGNSPTMKTVIRGGNLVRTFDPKRLAHAGTLQSIPVRRHPHFLVVLILFLGLLSSDMALREVNLCTSSSMRGSKRYSGRRPRSSKRETPDIVSPEVFDASLIEIKSASSTVSSTILRTTLYAVTFIDYQNSNNLSSYLTSKCQSDRIVAVNKKSESPRCWNHHGDPNHSTTGGSEMAATKFNPKPGQKAGQPAVPAFRRPSEATHGYWLSTLTQQPVLSPHFVVVLHDHISQVLFDWLKANAPEEIVELSQCRSSLQAYYEEFEAGNGFVSALTNDGFMDTVREGINALDKIGAGDFETMG